MEIRCGIINNGDKVYSVKLGGASCNRPSTSRKLSFAVL